MVKYALNFYFFINDTLVPLCFILFCKSKLEELIGALLTMILVI